MQAAEPAPVTIARADRTLVRISGAFKHFPVGGFSGLAVRAVDGVDLEIRRGETLGLVGESGCGKSTLARLVTGLLPVTGGTINFDGQEITKLRGAALRRVRRKMQMIFQDPFASLDPRMTVGDILQEPLDNYSIGTIKDRRRRVQELLRLVGLNPNFTNRYPPPLSGGQRQRLRIARALAVNPTFTVWDEPVPALAVPTRAARSHGCPGYAASRSHRSNRMAPATRSRRATSRASSSRRANSSPIHAPGEAGRRGSRGLTSSTR